MRQDFSTAPPGRAGMGLDFLDLTHPALPHLFYSTQQGFLLKLGRAGIRRGKAGWV